VGGAGAAGADAGGPQLVMARVKDALNLDPAHAVESRSFNITNEVMQNLVTFKPGSFDIAPDAARSWSVSPDGKTWTFELAPKLVFSDGTPLDAAAVKFNFDRWRLPAHPAHGSFLYTYYSSDFGGFPGLIADVQAPSPTRVVISLTQPLGPFLRDIAEQSFAIGSPKAITADPQRFEREPIGSGPYTVAEWVKNDHITLRANPTYAGPKPGYGTVVVRAIPDPATSVQLIRDGRIDMLTDAPPAAVTALAAQPGIAVAEQPSNNVSYLDMNVQRKPFGDVRVRRAVAYALDKTVMVKNLYAAGAVVADNWTPPGMLGENRAVKAYPHDAARARALLAAAGYPHGFATNLYYPTLPQPYLTEPQRVAEAMRDDLRAAGVRVRLVPFDNLRQFLDRVKHGDHEMCLLGWIGDNGDPDNFFYPELDMDSAHTDGTAQNYTYWRDPRFHALILAGQNTVDEAKRRAIYQRANAMVRDQVPAVPLVHTTVPLLLKSSLKGFVPSPNTSYHFELIGAPAGS
jgi:peptide/nickel transport system substrate-binding protein